MTVNITAEDVERLERWGARQWFLDHVRRIRGRHPAWTAVEVILHMERRRLLVLQDQPPGRYVVICGRIRDRTYTPVDDLSMPEARS